MNSDELKLETKCYDANEYGYLYGLNKKIPDEEFEKVLSILRDNYRQLGSTDEMMLRAIKEMMGIWKSDAVIVAGNIGLPVSIWNY